MEKHDIDVKYAGHISRVDTMGIKKRISKSELIKITDKKQDVINSDVLPEHKSTNPKTIPVKYPYLKSGHVTIFRVYNKTAGSGSGYYFVIKKSTSVDANMEPVMTLYTPKTDIIALERAIKKYRAGQE